MVLQSVFLASFAVTASSGGVVSSCFVTNGGPDETFAAGLVSSISVEVFSCSVVSADSLHSAPGRSFLPHL